MVVKGVPSGALVGLPCVRRAEEEPRDPAEEPAVASQIDVLLSARFQCRFLTAFPFPGFVGNLMGQEPPSGPSKAVRTSSSCAEAVELTELDVSIRVGAVDAMGVVPSTGGVKQVVPELGTGLRSYADRSPDDEEPMELFGQEPELEPRPDLELGSYWLS